MFTEQPSYSTRILRRPPGQDQFFFVNIENEWDYIAEAVVGSTVQPSTRLSQLILLLESHGVVIHRTSGLQPSHAETPSSVPDDIRSPFVTESPDDQAPISSAAEPTEYFFPRDIALVHGTRVIEAPPSLRAESSVDKKANVQEINGLFQRLETAGAEVIRWPSNSDSVREMGKVPEEKLVDVGGPQRDSDKEEEGPRFCPSDILILSPTLLITRLSSFTNNKGLEYLWSVLSRPSNGATSLHNDGGDAGVFRPTSRIDNSTPSRTTTLLVRVADSDAPAASSVPAISSPRLPMFGADISKNAVTGYIPLCRALVPINKRVMLYDPALITEDEARRLKSVLDRVQEDSQELEGSGGADPSGFYPRNHAKQDSVMSYGTFGSLNRIDDNGWQFISIDGLYLTSILMVSPQLALLSLASSTTSISDIPSATNHTKQRVLTNVSQVLESLGVRPVRLPSTNLSYWEPNGGVRDAVLVLRRESDLEASDYGNDQINRDGQDAEEGMGEGCVGAICAALSAWLCESSTSNEASEGDVSDRI